jgi:hypothetical protein
MTRNGPRGPGMSPFGTNQTNWAGLTMSVDWE